MSSLPRVAAICSGLCFFRRLDVIGNFLPRRAKTFHTD